MRKQQSQFDSKVLTRTTEKIILLTFKYLGNKQPQQHPLLMMLEDSNSSECIEYLNKALE